MCYYRVNHNDKENYITMTKILHPNDHAPYQIYNRDGDYPYIITVEHASNAIPKDMNGLGLVDNTLESHIAYDPYARQFSLDIANQLQCPLVTSEYSRLVIDCNRVETSHQLVRDESDGIIIQGNQNLLAEEISARQNAIYDPYHDAIREMKQKYAAKNIPFSFISMHSFTPQLNIDGKDRPWDLGFMWDHDDKLAVAFHDFFRKNYPDIRVGLNVPYDARVEEKGSMHIHAWPYDIPAVEIELNFVTMADTVKYKTILSGFVEFMKASV